MAQPLHAASRTAEVVEDFPTYCVTWLVSRVVGRWLSNASLFTLAAISVNRVLAINLKTRYRTVVTSKRIVAVLVVVWCVAALIACVRLFATAGNFLLAVASSYLVCLAIILVAYLLSFKYLRAHQENVQVHSGSSNVNVTGYQRSLHTMLYIIGFTLMCYLSYICLSTYTWRSPDETQLSGPPGPLWICWSLRTRFSIHCFITGESLISDDPFGVCLESVSAG